jgi:hypothetical protein
VTIRSSHSHPVEGPVCVLHSPSTAVYFGLTNDPVHAFGPFDSEAEARLWEETGHDDVCERLIIPLIDPAKVDRS